MKKIILLCTIYYALFTFLMAGSVTAEVSQKEVVAGNTVQLRIRARGDRAAFPNIQEIDGTKVLGRSQTQNNSISYINGKMSNEHSTSLILTFAPEHDMTIPAYTVTIDGQRYRTDPITIKVVKSTAPGVGNKVKYSLQMRADRQDVMVGEPLVVTVYFSLKTGVRLADNPQYSKPDFKGFFVKELKEPRTYIKGSSQVQELRYILTPQKEGTYTIGPATARVTEIDRNRRDMFGRFFGGTTHAIASNTLSIKVKPKPADTDLVGHFTLKSGVDHAHVKANKPVNLTVRIEGEGSLEDLELSNYDVDGVTVYSDDAKVQSHLDGGKLESTFVKSFAFISDHDFTIPERTLSVYDTKQGKVTTLKVPSYEIKVDAPKQSTAALPAADNSAGKVQTNLKLSSAPAEKVLEKPVTVQQVAWWMLVLAFAAGMLSLYLLQLLPKFRGRGASPYKESEALKILYGHMSDDPEAEAMVRKLYARQNGDKSVIIDKKELRALVERYRTS